MRVSEITRPRLKDWLAKIAAKNAPKMAILQLAVLRSLLEEAVEDEVISANPAVRLGRQVLNRAQRNSANIEEMTAEQLVKFLASIRSIAPDSYEPVVLLATTGVRISEGLALQWQDVDWEHRQLRVERQLGRDAKVYAPKTEESRRRVDLSTGAIELLRELRVRHERQQLTWGQPGAWILYPELGHRPDRFALRKRVEDLRRVMRRALRREEMPEHFTLHSFRHTFASLLLQRGWSPAYVQRQCGHSSIQVTVDTYGRWLPSGNLEAAEDLWSVIEGAPGVKGLRHAK